jgi:SAM-dependent methyltransferase
MQVTLYDDDLAFIQARGFGELAAAAAAAVIPLLQARGARRVVDVGCGAGVSTQALVNAGFDTLAIEPSEALLATAREAAPSARFRHASVYDVALEACDAILAFGEALTYHAPTDDAEARLSAFIDRASQALSKGGLFVFDLIEVAGGPLGARAWKAGPDWAVLSASHEDIENTRLTREIETFRDLGGGTYRRRAEVHHVRLFERRAVSSWLEQAGFEVEVATAYGAFDLAPRRVAFYASRL